MLKLVGFRYVHIAYMHTTLGVYYMCHKIIRNVLRTCKQIFILIYQRDLEREAWVMISLSYDGSNYFQWKILI